jgi:hypothetical protein
MKEKQFKRKKIIVNSPNGDITIKLWVDYLSKTPVVPRVSIESLEIHNLLVTHEMEEAKSPFINETLKSVANTTIAKKTVAKKAVAAKKTAPRKK